MKLRLGLVGLGRAWETRYRPALRALSDRFEVRAVCEQVAHRAEQAAKEFGAQAVDGFRALAFRDDVDAVLLLAPQWYGALPVFAACEAGKAVYCGAEIDVEPQLAEQVRQAVEKAGVAFMSEFPRRLAPATLRLKELICTQLGPPRLLFCHNRFPAEPTGKMKWDETPNKPTRDLIELVDWCRYVVGSDPSSVIGVRHDAPRAAADAPCDFDYEMMSLDFSGPGQVASGAVAQISASRYLSGQWPEAITFRPPAALQVACEHGVAFIDLPAGLTWFDRAGRHLESLESERPVGEQLLAQFHRAVTSLVRNLSSLDDAYRAALIVLSARDSQRSGQRVWLG